MKPRIAPHFHARLQMRALVLFTSAILVIAAAKASDEPFTGEWEIDLRTPAEKSAGAECGNAGFKLIQSGYNVVGEHWMATAGCGRTNDGGERTVVGVVRGGAATLIVTSGRNGEVVRGRATREGPNLRWKVLEKLKPGEPEGDSGLILREGLLRRKEG